MTYPYAMQATNGAWSLYYAVGGTEVEWPYQFPTENAALLFGATNARLLK